MVTSCSHLLLMPPGWPVTVARTGPVAELKRISMGAPGAVSRPMTRMVPPGCTVGEAVVSETGATQAHTMLAGTTTASAAINPTIERRQQRLIKLLLLPQWRYLHVTIT